MLPVDKLVRPYVPLVPVQQGLEPIPVELLLFQGPRDIAVGVAKGVWNYYSEPFSNNLNFAHTPKKQSTGKAGKDRHDKQYTHGGKNRPNNPNKKRGADERRTKGKNIN